MLNTRTTPILMALLVINMVANNFLGRSNNFTMIFPFAVFFSSMVLTSVGERPKKATSAPEIRAEQNNRIISMVILSTNAPSIAIAFREKLRGSGSNSQILGFIELKWQIIIIFRCNRSRRFGSFGRCLILNWL